MTSSKHGKLRRGCTLPSSGEVRGCGAAGLRQLSELLEKITQKSKLQEEVEKRREEVEKQRAVLQGLENALRGRERKLEDAARAHQARLDQLYELLCFGDEEQGSGSEPEQDGSTAAPSATLQGQPKNRKSKGPPVLAAWFKGRNCGAPLTLMCKNAVDHVLEGKEIQKEHSVYAKRNADYIKKSFMMCPSENIHVVEIRRRDGQEFDAKALKKKLDCLMKNYKGVERKVVYVAGQGPSLQHCNEEASKIPWQPSAVPAKAEEASCASAQAEQSPPESEVEPEPGVEVHAHPPEQAEQGWPGASA